MQHVVDGIAKPVLSHFYAIEPFGRLAQVAAHLPPSIHVGQVVYSEAARRQAMTSVFTGMAYASDMTATEHVPCKWRMHLWDVLMISERVFVVSLGALYPHNSIYDI